MFYSAIKKKDYILLKGNHHFSYAHSTGTHSSSIHLIQQLLQLLPSPSEQFNFWYFVTHQSGSAQVDVLKGWCHL